MENEQENKINPSTPAKQGIKVETFADDMARAIGNAKGGMIRQIIEEEERKEERVIEESPEAKKNQVFLIISIFLFLVACGVLVFLFLSKEDLATIPAKQQFVPIVFTDNTELHSIDELNKERMVGLVRNQIVTTEVKQNGVEALYLTENNSVIGFRRFLALIEGNMDLTLAQFLNDNFLLGVVNNQKVDRIGGDFFMLFKVRSFADIFDAFKSWEPKMFYDLHEFFGIELNKDNNYLATKDFENGIIQNKSARILYDNERNPVMMYIYADDTSVIVTDSEEATIEIMLRLSQSRVRK